jgi:hypothetical protein
MIRQHRTRVAARRAEQKCLLGRADAGGCDVGVQRLGKRVRYDAVMEDLQMIGRLQRPGPLSVSTVGLNEVFTTGGIW